MFLKWYYIYLLIIVSEFFNKLLKGSKKSFHEMFKKTYGILYEQNAYVFIDLFMELEKYYAKGSVSRKYLLFFFYSYCIRRKVSSCFVRFAHGRA